MLTDTNTDLASIFNQRLSWTKKKSGDFKWVEQMVDYYDYYDEGVDLSKKMKKLKLNYDLYNGRGEHAMRAFSQSSSSAILAEEGINLSLEEVQHHDIISHIAKSMVGEQRKRPLKPIVFDASGYALNDRKRKHLALLHEYIQNSVIVPLEQQITQEWMQEYGIEDPYQLSPEQQQQMQSDVAQRTQARTPKEIQEYMRKDYKAPSERQAQRLLEYIMRTKDVKWLTDENFKNVMCAGEEIYRIGVRHDDVLFELVNPAGFKYWAAPTNIFIEDGEAAKYSQNIKFTDVFNKYGDVLKEKDIKKLEDALQIGGSLSTDDHMLESKLVGIIDSNQEAFEGVNVRDARGQEMLRNIYDRIGHLAQAYGNIREVHVAWKSLRKLKRIKRMTKQGPKIFWVDESYRFHPLKGDLEEKSVWVPEVWEGTKLGGVDGIYVNKGPIPYQYNSVSNPWDVKLPYYGAQYNRLMGNSENVSPIDLGKPWQYKFNVQMARIHEIEATDMGKVMLTLLNAKPKDWSWGKFLTMMKYGKIAPIASNAEGLTPMDQQAIRSIDLSNVQDLASRLQYLEWLRNQVATSMSYNPSRLGEISPYTAVTNNQQNIVQSTNQTEDIFSMHNKIVENVLNALVNCGRIAFKNNPQKKTYVLDDMSIAELEVDWEMMKRAELGVVVANSSEDWQNIDIVKQQAQAMIQNGLISFPELIRLQWAKSYGEILNISEQAEERAERMRQEAAQQQQQLQQQQAQMQQELFQMEAQLKMLMQEREIQKDMYVADVSSTRFAQQADIDKNNINDANEREDKNRESKERIELEKLKLEREKLMASIKETEQKLAIEREKVRKMGNKKP